MFKKNKKPVPPKKRPDHIDDKYEDALRQRQTELEADIKTHSRQNDRQKGEMALWGVVAPIAFALDTVSLGAASAALALTSGALMLRAKNRVKKAEKELQEVNEDLFHYLEEVKYKHLLEETKKPEMPESPAEEFKKAASPEQEIEQLRQRILDFDKKFDPKNNGQKF